MILLVAGKTLRLSGRRFAIGTLAATAVDLVGLFFTETTHMKFLGL